jgi:acetyl esterase/lipase
LYAAIHSTDHAYKTQNPPKEAVIGAFAKFAAALLTLVVSACSPALLNITVPRGGYSLHRDINYGPVPRQKLDIYVPDGLTAPAPVILFFYGGNWDSGSKELYLAFGQAFASEGFVVAIADYRLYPAVKYPAFLEDSAAAFAFVHAHASQYGGDPGRIFLAGHSAGAYNAIMLVSDPHYLKDAGADIFQVRGAIGLAGPYDFLPLTDPGLIAMFGGRARKETQPITYIDGKRPPMLLAAGTGDETVGPGNTTRMAAKLRSFGSPVEVKMYPGVGHIGLILSLARPFRGRTSLRADMADFIRAH